MEVFGGCWGEAERVLVPQGALERGLRPLGAHSVRISIHVKKFLSQYSSWQRELGEVV
jgi:hypothetical protein